MPSLLRSVGRCSGVGGSLSVRHYLLSGQQAGSLSLAQRLDTPLNRGESVDSWLQQHSRVCDAINWQRRLPPMNQVIDVNYRDWPAEDKDRLQNMVNLYAACGMSNIEDPPVNMNELDDDEHPFHQFYDVHAAKTWYFASVAHSLTVDMGQWVPWRLSEYSDECLSEMLDSRSKFQFRHGPNFFEIAYNPYPPVVPARPRFTFEFMYKNDLIGNNRFDTLCRFLDWCRWNLGHAGGDFITSNLESYYGYRGFPPVRYIIEGDSVNDVHWTFGCHTSAGFYREALRSVNIPARYERRCGHGMPHFMHLDLYLSHSDEIYNANARRDDLAIQDILIDQDTFLDWFGDEFDECPPGASDNVGRALQEAVANLPPL